MDLQTTCIYDLTNRHVLEQLMTCDTHQVITCLQHIVRPIDYVMIPMNARYREAVYQLPCGAKPIIERDAVLAFFRCMVGEAVIGALEEVAVGEESDMPVGPDILTFIYTFYSAPTRVLAEASYNAWQRCIPTDDVFFYKVLRTFESYREELLGYFDMKEALDKSL